MLYIRKVVFLQTCREINSLLFVVFIFNTNIIPGKYTSILESFGNLINMEFQTIFKEVKNFTEGGLQSFSLKASSVEVFKSSLLLLFVINIGKSPSTMTILKTLSMTPIQTSRTQDVIIMISCFFLLEYSTSILPSDRMANS